MANVLVQDSSLTAIADAIRGKNGETTLYKPGDMAAAITNLPSGGGDLPEEALNISGSCNSRFAYNNWNWFINEYGDRVNTNGISSMSSMFNYSSELIEIPFTINTSNTSIDMTTAFANCTKLEVPATLGAIKVANLQGLFSYNSNLREFPEDYGKDIDWSYLEVQTGAYTGSQNQMFYNCYSLRKIPMNLIRSGNPNINYNYAIYNMGLGGCASLDELVDLPMYYKSNWNSNAFNTAFNNNFRLKRIVFKTDNGVPYTMNWKSQVISLDTSYVGYASSDITKILNYNSGITADKEVKDDATYAALKNDPDWWTRDVNYCRYNHTSAVETINSLPDTSAYLAANGGTNTIKFKGAAGSKTDGGAINTLTEAEIAVAAAKGWTVTLV